MQIFEFRDEVVGDYREYIESFISIADPRIREAVDRALKDGLLWRDPLVQINPRAVPISITGDDGAAKKLADVTGIDIHLGRAALEKTLLAGFNIKNPATEAPVFAFRLHQFISRGDTVYASLEPEESRYLTMKPQQFVPGDRTNDLRYPLER
jgi:hypothetical protein